MKIWTQSPLCLVQPDAIEPEEKRSERTLHMARNSYESFQILFKNEKDFKIEKISFEGSDPAADLKFSYNFQETIRFARESFQDPLSNEPAKEVQAETIQSVWITVYAGETANPGRYSQTARALTTDGTYAVKLEIQVYSALLPSNKNAAFSTEYWMNSVNFWFRYPSPNQLDFFRYHYGCERYSNQWWDLNRKIATHMKANRINVLFVRTHDLLLDGGSFVDAEGIYHFSWELFDRWIALFDKYADVKWFAGYHLVVQTEGKDVYMLDRVDGRMQIVISPIGSEKTENWMKQFLSALYAHLQDMGWQDRWLQHIEDEPAQSDSWQYARNLVRKYMPQIPCMDAIDHQLPMYDLQKEMDLWIPRVDVYEQNREFYDYRLAQGDKRWVYNCCEPHHQNYANKILGWPLIHNRVLPWGCFVNHFSGFLHWGYNFWDPEDIWFGLNDDVRIKGDGYIVYPDPAHNSIKNSVRMIATRDGAQDFELLTLLAARDPKKAFDAAKKVILRFNDFNWDPDNLEKIRIEILEAIG